MDKTEQANSFLNIIRSIIKEEQNKRDRVEICQINSVNEDGTVNIKMLSDFESIRIIPNISNQSIYSFKSGDLAIIYMIQNQLSNAFIIAKCGPTNESLRIYPSDSDTTGGGTVIQNITYKNETTPWTDHNTTYSAGTHISINGTTINALWPTASDSGYAGINKTGTVTGVKVNGTTKSPVDGVVDIGPVPTVVQTTGTSTTNVMSQNSVTNEFGKKADLFVKETGINQISSGKSYELGNVSSMTNFPTINAAEFTSINDVSQICFKASANFAINMPSTTYLCIGDGLSGNKAKLTTVAGKSYCITVGHTPFGIQIVSAIVDVL